VFGETAEIVPKADSVTYYTDKYLSFDPAVDGESSVDKYNIKVSGGTSGDKDIEMDSGD